MKIQTLTLLCTLAATPAHGIEANDAAADANVPQAASAAASAPQDEETPKQQQQQQQLRKLQATQKPCDTSLWRPVRIDYQNSYCSQGNIQNCNEVGYSTELACCKQYYPNQVSGACLQKLPNPPTTSPTKEGGMDEYYPDYSKQWAEGTCINDYPLPNGRPTYSSQLACCKGAYLGQASGACLMDLPNPPTTSPTTEVGEVYYPMYEETWSEGYCSNERPFPFTHGGRPTYDSQLACCKQAYAGQTSGKCLMMLPNPPTTSPTTEVGELYYPMYEEGWDEGYCSNERPWPFTHGGRPTYDDQLTCCKGAYAGQTSGKCLMMLPNPPTTSPTAEEGLWYPDINQDFGVGTCSNAYPTNTNNGVYETQEECCKGFYSSQTSDACMCDVDPCHSCKCFNFDSVKNKIKAAMSFDTNYSGETFNEFYFKLYCTNPGKDPGEFPIDFSTGTQGGGTNPNLTFDECCTDYNNADCMCKSEPCYSCECYPDPFFISLAAFPFFVDITDEYTFHEACIGNDDANGDSLPTFVRNTNLEQCYADPTKQPTAKPTAARRLGAAPPADDQ